MIARAIQAVNINPRSFMISGLMFLGIIGLFLIPEMVGSSNERPPGIPAPVENAAAPAAALEASAAAAVAPAQLSPLEGVLQSMDAKSQLAAESGVAVSVENLQQSANGVVQIQVTPGANFNQAIAADPVDWAKIASPDMSAALSKARTDIANLVQHIKNGTSLSLRPIFALNTLANGIVQIQAAATNTATWSGTPEESLAYLESLDAEVTTRLVAEKADERVMNLWTQISLGPLLANSKAARLKERYKVPWKPEVAMTSPATIALYDNDTRSRLHLNFLVKAPTLSKASMYHNGKFLEMLSMSGEDALTGYRWIVFHYWTTAEGIFTLRLEGTHGEIYEKSYRFMPNARKFKMREDGRYFILPGHYERTNRPRAELDRAFAAGSKLTIDGRTSQMNGNLGGRSVRSKRQSNAARVNIPIPADFEPTDMNSSEGEDSWDSF